MRTLSLRGERSALLRAFGMALMLSTSVASIDAVRAQDNQTAAVTQRSFSIPAGPLSSTLVSFGEQAGVQVSYVPSVAAGLDSPGVSGSMSVDAALSQLLAGTGLSYQLTGTTVTVSEPSADTGATLDGAIALDTITVSGGEVGAAPEDLPYETAAPTAYISQQRIERFRGSSPADMFRGTPGVMSGEARNSGSSVDVNIRGMQGMGRVAVKVDGAENQVTIYQGYQGISNRTFVDPDFLAGIDITKGSDAASSGIAGTVNMRTVDADDIVKPGDTYGFRVKGEVGGNTTSPTAGNVAGYRILNNLGSVNNPDSGYPTIEESTTGMDRPDPLTPTQGSASIVGAVKSDDFDFVAGYAHRKQGNYFAGTNGPSAQPATIGPQPFCYSNGTCPPQFLYRDYAVNTGLANYRAGEEVLNTQLETKSWLMKATIRLDDNQSVKFGYNAFRSEAGDKLASVLNADTSQDEQLEQTAGVKLDTGTLKYRWQPDDNDLVDVKSNLWVTQLEQRNPIRVKNYFVTPETLGLPDGFRVGSDTTMWGGDVSNTSKLMVEEMPVQLTYGLSYKYEEIHPSEYTEDLELYALRDGSRHEAAGYGKVTWDATEWLTVTGGLRYQQYWSRDGSSADPTDVTGESHGQNRDDGGFSPSVGVTVEPVEGTQLYVNYSDAMRMPSMMETLTGFSTRYNPDLVPERSRNWEIGANVIEEGILSPSDRGMLKLGYFNWNVKDYLAREWVQDFVTPTGTPISTLYVYNLDKAKFEGVELSSRYELGGFTAELAANYYLNVEFCRTANTCENKSLYSDYATNQVPPKYMVDLTLSQKLLDDDLTVGGRIHHVGARAIGHGEVTAEGLSQFIALVDWERYTLVDLFAEYRLTENLTLNARVENLTDLYYVDPLSLVQQPSPGRTIYAGITSTIGGAEPVSSMSPLRDDLNASVDWTGPYLGFHTGGVFAHEKGTTTALDGTPGGIPGTESADLDLKGNYLYGAQAGFNYQFDNGLVLGFEADYSKTALEGSQKASATEGTYPGTGNLQAETHYDIDWLATLRGKVGYAFDSGLMVYATAGAAFSREKTTRDQYRSTDTYGNAPYADETEMIGVESVKIGRTGWTAGGGMEYALNSGWSISADYTYTRLNRKAARYSKARAGVGRSYTSSEILGYEWVDPSQDPVISQYCDIFPGICDPYEQPIYEFTDHEGTSETSNGREASNWIGLHSVRIGLNYHF